MWHLYLHVHDTEDRLPEHLGWCTTGLISTCSTMCRECGAPRRTLPHHRLISAHSEII